MRRFFRYLSFLCALGLATIAMAEQPKVSLSGHVTSKWTGEALAGVNIFFPSLKIGTITDAMGAYTITLPTGTFTVEFTRVGLNKEQKMLDLVVNRKLDIEMSEKTLELEEFVIYSEKADANVKSLDVGKNTLNIEKISALPSFMGEPDVIKSLMLLPGVSTVGEGASGFNVRGGGIDQNLVLQDGGMMFNASHVFGFFSAFNPLVVQQATLYKSGIPASYGGRLSSVLDVETRDGNFREYKVTGGVGLVSSKLALEGPILKNKVSVLLAGRIFYTDWLLKKAHNLNVKKSSATFSDMNTKITYLLNEKNKLSYAGYLSTDGFSFASDTLFSWQTANHVLQWQYDASERMSIDVTGVIGQYQYQIENTTGKDAFRIDSYIKNKSLKARFNFTLNESHKLNFGTEAILYDFSPGIQTPLAVDSGIPSITIEKERSLETALFVEDEMIITPKLSIKPGLRFSRFTNFGPGSDYVYGPDGSKNTPLDTVFYSSGEEIASYQGFEPRVVLNYTINDKSSVKLSYNRNRQYLHLISNTTAATPTDFWKTTNRYIQPEIGDQYSIGYFRNWRNNSIETSIEAYRKTAENVLDYRDGAVLLMNENIEAELLSGSSEAYGVELFINKKTGNTTGWISYTYSRTFRTIDGEQDDEKINFGARYPANFDKPHDITINISHKVSPVVEFGANFTYSTGRPMTVPLSAYETSNLSGVANYSLRNQARIPDYHRLDLSMTVKSKPRIDRKWSYSWTLSVYNVYARKNAYSVFFKNQLGSPPKAYQLSVLGHAFPSITVNFSF